MLGSILTFTHLFSLKRRKFTNMLQRNQMITEILYIFQTSNRGIYFSYQTPWEINKLTFCHLRT